MAHVLGPLSKLGRDRYAHHGERHVERERERGSRVLQGIVGHLLRHVRQPVAMRNRWVGRNLVMNERVAELKKFLELKWPAVGTRPEFAPALERLESAGIPGQSIVVPHLPNVVGDR